MGPNQYTYKDQYIQTTIGQLNFFKWALEMDVIHYIEENYKDIETDMNARIVLLNVPRIPVYLGNDVKNYLSLPTKNILHEEVEIIVEFV